MKFKPARSDYSLHIAGLSLKEGQPEMVVREYDVPRDHRGHRLTAARLNGWNAAWEAMDEARERYSINLFASDAIEAWDHYGKFGCKVWFVSEGELGWSPELTLDIYLPGCVAVSRPMVEAAMAKLGVRTFLSAERLCLAGMEAFYQASSVGFSA